MPGHNAFQRNAFQRNAFQIVYEFAPTVTGGIVLGGSTTSAFRSAHHPVVTGGIVLGGSVTTAFRSSHNPVVTGGIVIGGSVTTSYRAAGQHVAIVTGGIVLGGSVRSRFTAGQRERFGSPGRVFRDIFAKKHHFKPTVKGGIVLGSNNVVAEHFENLEGILPSFEIPGTLYLPVSNGGIILGGGVQAEFYASPPEPILEIPAPEPSPPDPIRYKAYVGKREPILAGGVKASFKSNPPLPKRVPVFSGLKRQQLEEDELLLMDLI